MFDGRWAYQLDNAHVAVQSLDRGESRADTFPVEAVNGSTRLVAIRIDGAEDAPLIAGDSTGIVALGRWTTFEGALSISDVDSADNPIGFGDVPAAPGSAGLGSAGLGNFELRDGTWTYRLDEERLKLISQPTGQIALYDLLSDPDESKNLAGSNPEEVRRLQDDYALWNSDMTAPPAFPPKKRQPSQEQS